MNTKSNYLVPLAIVGMLFFLLGFALGINGLLIPFLQKAFSLTNAQSYLVLTATYGAFVVFGYPSGLIIKRVGYRQGIVISFILFAVGLYLFVPSARFESFGLFLVASFLSGMANTLLQAAINPYITILGPIEAAAQRMCIMTICNRAGWAVSPVFLALFINIAGIDVQLSSLFTPFYIIVAVFVALGIFTAFAPLPEISAAGEDEASQTTEAEEVRRFVETKTSVWQFPHLLLGIVALFFYVGIDTLALVSPVDFANSIGLPHPERYTSITVGAISIGCVLGIVLVPRYISQLKGLQIGSLLALTVSFLIALTPPLVAVYLVSLMSFSLCLVWGAVWPLAIANLGKFTKTGSALLVSSCVGGAILPLIFGWFKDLFGDIQQAYWLFVPCVLFIVYYAFRGYRVGLKV